MPSSLPEYVKPSILEFKRLELDYLDNLSPGVKKKLAGRIPDFKTERNHIRHYGDFAFTIGGIKPCALFAHGIGPFFAKGLAEAALLPVMRQFDLESHGFKAEEIKHRMLTSNPVHPGFQGGWVLLNTRHPGYELAKKTFLEPSPTGRVDEEQIRIALGYPLPSHSATMSYIDATEARDMDTCCVPVVEYFCPDGYVTAMPILTHYHLYREFWEQLGRNLTIDCSRHAFLKRTVA